MGEKRTWGGGKKKRGENDGACTRNDGNGTIHLKKEKELWERGKGASDERVIKGRLLRGSKDRKNREKKKITIRPSLPPIERGHGKATGGDT